MEIYKQIRKMRLEGMSQRQIAATLHISRNTVKKYWDGNSGPMGAKSLFPTALHTHPGGGGFRQEVSGGRQPEQIKETASHSQTDL